MGSPITVLVHGAMHGAWCWDGVVSRMETRTLAVDLPGRTGPPELLRDLGVLDFVQAIVSEIDAARAEDMVLVGHSLAGVLLPAVAQWLGDRVSHVVLVTCVVPPLGRCVLDLIPGWIRPYIEYRCKRGLKASTGSLSLPRSVARFLFCNGMDRDQRDYVLDRLGQEAPRVLFEPTKALIDPAVTPTTWVRLTRDVAVPRWKQDSMALRLGVKDIHDIQAGHDAMISNPGELAGLLDTISRAGPRMPSMNRVTKVPEAQR